jgi:hypothetical protein
MTWYKCESPHPHILCRVSTVPTTYRPSLFVWRLLLSHSKELSGACLPLTKPLLSPTDHASVHPSPPSRCLSPTDVEDGARVWCDESRCDDSSSQFEEIDLTQMCRKGIFPPNAEPSSWLNFIPAFQQQHSSQFIPIQTHGSLDWVEKHPWFPCTVHVLQTPFAVYNLVLIDWSAA